MRKYFYDPATYSNDIHALGIVFFQIFTNSFHSLPKKDNKTIEKHFKEQGVSFSEPYSSVKVHGKKTKKVKETFNVFTDTQYVDVKIPDMKKRDSEELFHIIKKMKKFNDNGHLTLGEIKEKLEAIFVKYFPDIVNQVMSKSPLRCVA